MKIHILYPFVDGPWGGANQFLKATRDYFVSIGAYEENIQRADVVLFNSSPNSLVDLLAEVFKLKREFPNKIFVNRIDGPVFFIRDRNSYIDKAFYLFNEHVCDGTIFQSDWSKNKNYDLGMKKNNFETTILNAPNSNIFNCNNRVDFSKEKKVKLIVTSWSNNLKKGFNVYKWLDENLDFSKYELTFIGNSPYKFKNIKSKKPMDSEALSMALRKHHIFITASQQDPCSNALIEALHCGLPAIGLNDGGHTEIIAKGGEVFLNEEEIPKILEKIVKGYRRYQSNIQLPDINRVGQLYFNFLSNIYHNVNSSKSFKTTAYLKIKVYLQIWKFNEKIYTFKNRLKK